MDIKDCIIYEKTIPAHPAVYDDFPENLLPELAEYLKSHGIGKLYCHQTEMFEKVTSGKNALGMKMTSWLAQISISGSAPKNTDETVEAFVDINGDGLPDKIMSDKKVRLNYGYSFSDPIDWGLTKIQTGKSLSYSGGLGFDIASSSVSAGVGLVTSESTE